MAALNFFEHNKKVAKLRGQTWKNKLREAKLMKNATDSKALAKARFDSGLTQREVTRKLGLRSNTPYARIEQGLSSTNRKRAEFISQLLNKKVSDLFIEFDTDKFIAI